MGLACATPQVLVVLSEDGAAYHEAAEAMRGYLHAQGVAVALRTVRLAEMDNAIALQSQADILVAVGTRAMQALARDVRPTLNILVPRQNFELVRPPNKLDPRLFSAIYLDQPIARRLRLIKQLLPGRRRVGVLLGPTTPDRIKSLQQSAREQQLALDVAQVSSQDEIIPALNQLLANSQALLALPDPLIYNQNTAQSILLTSYRAQIPLIAYSNAYVQAGALAAVFSTPSQIGQQAAEMLMRTLQTKNFALPAPQYPKYFSVSVNYQVARSLGFVLEDEATLLDQMKVGAERE